MQNRDNIARARADSSKRAHQLFDRCPLFQKHTAGLLLLHRHVGLLGYLRRAGTHRIWLGDLRNGLDFDVKIALHDRDRRNLHVLPHHDGAGTFVDDDDGFAIRLHGEAVHFRNEFGGLFFVFRRKRDGDHGGVFGVCDGAESIVERFGDPRGRDKIGALKLQAQMRREVQARRPAFHDRAVRNTAHCGVILSCGVNAASGLKSPQHQRALRHRVNLTVRGLQSRHEQDPALQAG